jgi:hypothetical protein
MQRKNVNIGVVVLAAAVLAAGACMAGESPSALAGEQITIAGTIDSILSAGAYGSANEHQDGAAVSAAGDVLMFRLKADDGSMVNVDAGSKAALDRQSLVLHQGAKITVTGNRAVAGATDRVSAAGAIMARTIQKGSQTVQVERSATDQKQPPSPSKDPDPKTPRR